MNPATTEVLKPCRRHSRSSSSSLAGEVLASDPMLESVYRAGLLTVKDLRSLAACLHSRVRCGAAAQGLWGRCTRHLVAHRWRQGGRTLTS